MVLERISPGSPGLHAWELMLVILCRVHQTNNCWFNDFRLYMNLTLSVFSELIDMYLSMRGLVCWIPCCVCYRCASQVQFCWCDSWTATTGRWIAFLKKKKIQFFFINKLRKFCFLDWRKIYTKHGCSKNILLANGKCLFSQPWHFNLYIRSFDSITGLLPVY